tara:strand:+ start:1331 stop:1540 length:210 start_codon:yes stop_codon:yes gene_type:complete
MCVSVKAPSMPPAPDPAPVAPPPITQNTQGSARPAGYSEAEGRSMNTASSYDRKRTGASNLRIPIIGGL